MRLRKKGASPRGKKWQKIIQQKVSFVLLCHPEFFRLYQTNGWAVKLFLIALCQVQFQKVKNNANGAENGVTHQEHTAKGFF